MEKNKLRNIGCAVLNKGVKTDVTEEAFEQRPEGHQGVSDSDARSGNSRGWQGGQRQQGSGEKTWVPTSERCQDPGRC